MFRHVILIAVMVAMPLCSALAEEKAKDTHLEAAMRLLEITNSEKTMDASVNQMITIQVKQNPMLAPYENVLRSFLKKYVGWDALKDDLAKIYKEEFTEKELNDIIAFYKTPTGKKAAQKLPALMRKGAQLGAKRVQANLGELKEMIREEQAKQL